MTPTHVLFIGGTGSVERYAVEEALKHGYDVRVITRHPDHVSSFEAAVSMCHETTS